VYVQGKFRKYVDYCDIGHVTLVLVPFVMHKVTTVQICLQELSVSCQCHSTNIPPRFIYHQLHLGLIVAIVSVV